MAAVHAGSTQPAGLAEQKKGLVVLMQANPFIVLPRDGYGELRLRLASLGERMPGRVILVHGDTHVFPRRRTDSGVRRVEVWGSPFHALAGRRDRRRPAQRAAGP
jgi:hypothetical protein